MINFYFCFLFLSLLSAYLSNKHKELAVFSILCSIISFFVLGVFVEDSIAQDRSQYFLWYLEAREIYNRSDFLFTWFLSILPAGLNKEELYIILLGLLIGILLNTFRLINKRFYFSYETLALVFIFVISDRIFIDLSLNTLRSSIALLIAISALISLNSYILRIIVLLIAFGIHQLAVGILILLYLAYWLCSFYPRSIKFIAIFGIFCFILRFFSYGIGFSEFPENLLLEYSIDSERIIRSVQVTELKYSISLAFQLLLAVVIPMTAYLWQTSSKTRNITIYSSNNLNTSFLNIGAFFGGIFLIFYPEITTALRFSIIPLLFLSITMPKNILRTILFVKFISLTYALN